MRLALALLAAPLACTAHAEYDDDQVRQLEAFATKWERDAATLLTGEITGGDRRERMGRAFGFQRAADDIRLHLNRPIPTRTRENAVKPWPPTDVRGTDRLMELILPGFGGAGAVASEREGRAR